MYTHPSFAKAIVKGFDPSTHTPLSLSLAHSLSLSSSTQPTEKADPSPPLREHALVLRPYDERVRKQDWQEGENCAVKRNSPEL